MAQVDLVDIDFPSLARIVLAVPIAAPPPQSATSDVMGPAASNSSAVPVSLGAAAAPTFSEVTDADALLDVVPRTASVSGDVSQSPVAVDAATPHLDTSLAFEDFAHDAGAGTCSTNTSRVFGWCERHW